MSISICFHTIYSVVFYGFYLNCECIGIADGLIRYFFTYLWPLIDVKRFPCLSFHANEINVVA